MSINDLCKYFNRGFLGLIESGDDIEIYCIVHNSYHKEIYGWR